MDWDPDSIALSANELGPKRSTREHVRADTFDFGRRASVEGKHFGSMSRNTDYSALSVSAWAAWVFL